MLDYIDKHIIDFVDEWGDKVISQLDNIKYFDSTEIYKKTKKSRIILNSIKSGKRIYTLGFKNCKGMIKKWLYDRRGRMIRDKGRGIIEVNPSVIAMSIIDINVPFISSDEVLLVKYHKDKPYNLEKEIVIKAMEKEGLDPDRDIQFIFFLYPKRAKITINRFIDDFRHIITKEYCRAKGVLILDDPKWRKYHGSEGVTRLTNTFFFNGVSLLYSKRESFKKEKIRLNL